MHDTGRVGRGQRIGHLGTELQHLCERDRSIRNLLVQAGAGQVLHHDEICVVGGLDRVDRHDARMVERGRGSGLDARE